MKPLLKEDLQDNMKDYSAFTSAEILKGQKQANNVSSVLLSSEWEKEYDAMEKEYAATRRSCRGIVSADTVSTTAAAAASKSAKQLPSPPEEYDDEMKEKDLVIDVVAKRASGKLPITNHQPGLRPESSAEEQNNRALMPVSSVLKPNSKGGRRVSGQMVFLQPKPAKGKLTEMPQQQQQQQDHMEVGKADPIKQQKNEQYGEDGGITLGVAAPTLQRGQNVQTTLLQSQPGAYASAPMGNTELQQQNDSFVESDPIPDPLQQQSHHSSNPSVETTTLSLTGGAEEQGSICMQDSSNGDLTSDGELTVANAIDDSSSRRSDLPIAEELDMTKRAGHSPKTPLLNQKTCSSTRCLLLASCIFNVILLGLLLALFLKYKRESDESTPTKTTAQPTLGPSLAPTLSIESYVLTLLPEDTLVAMEDPTSPQAQAYQWLVNDTIYLPHLSDHRILQRFALATTFYATEGSKWFSNDSWLDHEVHECNWWSTDTHDDTYQYIEVSYNSSCEEDTSEFDVLEEEEEGGGAGGGMFQHFWMRGNNLGGELPNEFFWLTNLRSINLDGCHVGGTLSTAIGALTNLEDISLGANELTGRLPVEIFSLEKLGGIWFHYNYFTGQIPSEVGLLSVVQYLVLDANQLSGPIPSQMGNMGSVQFLNLANNPLGGSIPTQIGMLRNLRGVKFSKSQLTGTLPSEIGHLTKASEAHFDTNMLTGTIPSELGLLSSMELLDIEDNNLTGEIPSQLGLLASLNDPPIDILGMRGNDGLSGVMPERLCHVRILAFDCTDQLCGCDCECMPSTSNLNETFTSTLNGTYPMDAISSNQTA